MRHVNPDTAEFAEAVIGDARRNHPLTILDWTAFPRDAGVLTELCELTLRLPDLNQELTSGRRCPDRTVRELMAVAAKPAVAGVLPEDDREATYLWISSCFLVATAERWGRVVGFEPGTAYQMLGPNGPAWVEEMMRRTDAVAPRMGVDEYWLKNLPTASSPTFTGSTGEHMFRAQVHLVDGSTREIMAALGPIMSNEVKLADSHELLKACTTRAVTMNKGVLDLSKAFAPGEFHRGMRQALLPIPCPVASGNLPGESQAYIGDFPVGGKVFEGPNAANIVGVPMLDLSLGLDDQEYRAMIQGRFRWYAPDDLAQIKQCLAANRSMVDIVAESLGVPTSALVAMPVSDVAKVLMGSTPAVMQAASELAKFCEFYRKWSGAHFGAISKHVIDAGKHIPNAELAILPISSQTGVSGNSVSHARHVADLRRAGFLTHRLPAAMRIATPAANDPVFAGEVG